MHLTESGSTANMRMSEYREGRLSLSPYVSIVI
jgi:hypothetical protein